MLHLPFHPLLIVLAVATLVGCNTQPPVPLPAPAKAVTAAELMGKWKSGGMVLEFSADDNAKVTDTVTITILGVDSTQTTEYPATYQLAPSGALTLQFAKDPAPSLPPGEFDVTLDDQQLTLSRQGGAAPSGETKWERVP